MSWQDSWKSGWELEGERQKLRDEWPYRSYDHECEALDRIRDITRELDRREEQRHEEEAREREPPMSRKVMRG